MLTVALEQLHHFHCETCEASFTLSGDRPEYIICIGCGKRYDKFDEVPDLNNCTLHDIYFLKPSCPMCELDYD